MLNVSKCEYKDSFEGKDCGCLVHYFMYPKSIGEFAFHDFFDDDELAELVSESRCNVCLCKIADKGRSVYHEHKD